MGEIYNYIFLAHTPNLHKMRVHSFANQRAVSYGLDITIKKVFLFYYYYNWEHITTKLIM